MKKLIDVPEEVMKALKGKAERLGISLNALINLILYDEYVRIKKKDQKE